MKKISQKKIQDTAKKIQADIVVLYGSYASGKIHRESDLDIAVAKEGRIDLEERLEISQIFEDELGIDTDVIDLNQLQGTILSEVMTKGKFLVCKNRKLKAHLIKKLWIDQEEFMPVVRSMLKIRRNKFLYGT